MLFGTLDHPEITWSGGGAIVAMVGIIGWLVRTYREDTKEARNEFRAELAAFRADMREITEEHSKAMNEVVKEMASMRNSLERIGLEVAEMKDRGPNRHSHLPQG